MSRVILSKRAKADLRDIGSYISQHNETAAKRWVQKLRTTCKTTMGKFPECGTKRDDLLPGLRCFSVGNYLIYFRGRNPVEILRIVHGARDESRLTFEDE
jgi:toxin ParE1/3/4